MSNHASTYAPAGGGATNLTASVRPEPKRDDPADDKLSTAELLKQMRWTDTELSVARSCGLGGPAYQVITPRGQFEFHYSRKALAQWVDRVKSLRVR